MPKKRKIKNITKTKAGFKKNETYPSFKVSRRKRINVSIPDARKSSVLNCRIISFILVVIPTEAP